MRCRCDVRSVCIQHCMVSPTIVLIFYHNIPVAVKNGGNISLRVFTVKICRIIVFYAGNARLVVNELQSVALLYDSAVFIVGKGNAALARLIFKGEVLPEKADPFQKNLFPRFRRLCDQKVCRLFFQPVFTDDRGDRQNDGRHRRERNDPQKRMHRSRERGSPFRPQYIFY